MGVDVAAAGSGVGSVVVVGEGDVWGPEALGAPSKVESIVGSCPWSTPSSAEAGSDPRGHLGVTWGVYLCAGKPPLADILLSHPPDLT